MKRRFAAFLLLCLPWVISAGCNPGTPNPNADKTTPPSESSAEPSVDFKYLKQRKQFKTKLIRKGPAPQETEVTVPARFIHPVEYPSLERNLKGWVYLPDDDTTRRRPALVFCHGGFAASANDLLCVEPFLNGDYVVFGPSWRGESGNSGNFELMLGEVDDAANAVRWLAQQPYVDPDRIYMFGHSVGGGIAALVSLMNDVPLRHSGSSGGLYPDVIFKAWSPDITPFDYRDRTECAMRLLDGNTRSMQVPHYAFLGQNDYDEGFSWVAKKYLDDPLKAPLLKIQVIPGDHFSSFDEAVERYFQIVESDRQ